MDEIVLDQVGLDDMRWMNGWTDRFLEELRTSAPTVRADKWIERWMDSERNRCIPIYEFTLHMYSFV